LIISVYIIIKITQRKLTSLLDTRHSFYFRKHAMTFLLYGKTSFESHENSYWFLKNSFQPLPFTIFLPYRERKKKFIITWPGEIEQNSISNAAVPAVLKQGNRGYFNGHPLFWKYWVTVTESHLPSCSNIVRSADSPMP
jgi:hypothetical protein